jgi:hypothetical protein
VPLATLLAALGMVEVMEDLPIAAWARHAIVAVVVVVLSLGPVRQTWRTL